MTNGLQPRIRFGHRDLNWNSGESLLDALDRQGVAIPSSCRAGACHSCLMRALGGEAPPEGQAGLKPAWKRQGLFLACLCRHPMDLELELPGPAFEVKASLMTKEILAPDIVMLRLKPENPLAFKAGQFFSLSLSLNLGHGISTTPTPTAVLTRSYSSASSIEDGFIEMHVRRQVGGLMSGHLFDEAQLGERFLLRGPFGDCFYTAGQTDQTLLLLATGTGLASLLGLARDALKQGHQGQLHLFHGGRVLTDLYRHEALLALAKEHKNFHYRPILSDEAMEGIASGRLPQAVATAFPDMRGFRAFLCGSPAMVMEAKRLAYEAGVRREDIFSDPFFSAPRPSFKRG